MLSPPLGPSRVSQHHPATCWSHQHLCNQCRKQFWNPFFYLSLLTISFCLPNNLFALETALPLIFSTVASFLIFLLFGGLTYWPLHTHFTLPWQQTSSKGLCVLPNPSSGAISTVAAAGMHKTHLATCREKQKVGVFSEFKYLPFLSARCQPGEAFYPPPRCTHTESAVSKAAKQFSALWRNTTLIHCAGSHAQK